MNKKIGSFNFIKTDIKDVYIIEPTQIKDNRGYFMETYKETIFKELGLNYNFIQDNQSKSKKGVLRGLHFQIKHPQTKLVRVIDGEIFDVCVDLRKNSPTYGKWIGAILSSSNNKQLLIPKGFAHGFLVLSDTATICYKCDEQYYPDDEGGILWNDPNINIDWPMHNDIILSDKDKSYSLLNYLNIEM